MQVSTTTLQPLFEGVKQYVVPLFQRTYSWDKKEWSALWDDLFDLYQEEITGLHFMGSIVTIPTKTVPEGVTKYLLIDGQQRMTTFYLLLLSIKKTAEENEDFKFSEEIHEILLVNKFKEKSIDYYKILPTQKDRNSLIDISEKKEETGFRDKIQGAYNFFIQKITKHSVDIKKMYNILLKKLSIVSIVLDESDDPHIVFESLNYKGLPLSHADLIRNYFFMKIHIEKQNAVYDDIWMPMQSILGDNLPDFVRHFIMKDGDYVNVKDIYAKLKEEVNRSDSIEYMKNMSSFSIYYNKLLNPEQEENKAIQYQLKNIKRLDMATSYPFLLNVYNDYALKKIKDDEFCEVLKILENFIVRRQVCGVPSNQLNKIFPIVYSQMMNNISSKLSYIEKLCSVLKSKNYPNDVVFMRSFHSYKLYGTGREKLGRTILERIEKSYFHKETPDLENLEIEHIMPQTLSVEWEKYLGDDFNETHSVFLHTLGNLTLTAYNAELRNYLFEKKRSIYQDSRLGINKYFNNICIWNEDEIQNRTNFLAELLAKKGYPYFGEDKKFETSLESTDLTSTKPQSVRIFGQDFQCKSWIDVLKTTLQTVVDLDPEKMENLIEEFPNFIGKSDTFKRGKSLECKFLKTVFWYESKLRANRIYYFCNQVIDSLSRDTDDFRVTIMNS